MCSSNHRNLHSFPTRRSSDLTTPAQPHGLCAHRASDLLTLDARSEEHTSELQSRVDLVCRLLLEKKNSTASNRGRATVRAPSPAAAPAPASASPATAAAPIGV